MNNYCKNLCLIIEYRVLYVIDEKIKEIILLVKDKNMHKHIHENNWYPVIDIWIRQIISNRREVLV